MVGHNKASQGADALAPIKMSEYKFHSEVIAPLMLTHAASIGLEAKVFLRNEGIMTAMANVNAWLKGHQGVCIELHFNASTPTGTGTEVLIDLEQPENRAFGKLVNDSMMKVLKLKQRHGDTEGLKILKKGYRGHRNVTGITAIGCLVEPFFGSNAADCVAMWENKEAYAKCLVDAAAQFLGAKAAPAKETPVSEIKVPKEVAMAFAKRQELESTCNWIFEVDYSINSRKPRLFVYGIKEKKLYKYKTAHGVGGDNRTPNNGVCREVSNASGSLMSSLGYIKTGPKYQSDSVGTAVRLNGLSPTNSKNLARGVVLHGASYVYDNEGNTDTSVCGRSYGCVVTDDKYINKTGGGELIEWLRDGSIGVTHYAGKFVI